MNGVLYQATKRSATFGFVVADGRVVEVAPYGRKWMLGRSEEEILRLLRMRGFRVLRAE